VKRKTVQALFMSLILCPSFSIAETRLFKNKDEVISYFMKTYNDPENARQIKPSHMMVRDIDKKGGNDIYVIDPNYSGTMHGDGGGAFLCQGNEPDCSDSYFCEADTLVLYENQINAIGPKLQCKKH